MPIQSLTIYYKFAADDAFLRAAKTWEGKYAANEECARIGIESISDLKVAFPTLLQNADEKKFNITPSEQIDTASIETIKNLPKLPWTKEGKLWILDVYRETRTRKKIDCRNFCRQSTHPQ
jgi:hypothetical protein